MQVPDLQCLFDHEVVSVDYLDPGYSEHASDVWLVRTTTDEVIVRSSRLSDEPTREFWWGCLFLFGIDPRHMRYFAENARMLRAVPDIRVPEIIDIKSVHSREYILVEKMQGLVPKSFIGQSVRLLNQFGRWLAQVHLNRFNYFGNLAQTKTANTKDFHRQMGQAMTTLVDREYEPASKISRYLPTALSELSALPPPEYFCPILVDLDPSQFLVEGDQLSAIVDIEAYVVGPREFDFIGLEYVLDDEAWQSFTRGYTEILDMPDLSRCRNVYRYLYRLLGVQGSVDLDTWFFQPVLF